MITLFFLLRVYWAVGIGVAITLVAMIAWHWPRRPPQPENA